jgi:RimJ/RimL family protein N-acetyltransferase
VGASLALPDPPLVDTDAGVRLRPWTDTPADVAALAAAWADPAIAAANVVPADASAATAARWLAGDTARRSAGRNLDLAIAPIDGGPQVLGEVGLRNIDRRRRRAELSWWICPEHRRRRLATAATRLLADWALADDGGDLVQVWARVDPANAASARVAAAAGLVPLGAAGGAEVWARSRVATPSG